MIFCKGRAQKRRDFLEFRTEFQFTNGDCRPQKDSRINGMENISTLENSSSLLSVTLHENNFTKDGSYYATVTRNTATFKNILSEIAEDNKGMDPYMLQFAAILIQKKILKMLEQGKAVNVLDLGTLYIAMKCNAKGKSEVSGSGNFYIKFTPTELANSSLSKLSVDKIVYADGTPEIIAVEDLSEGSEEGRLTRGKPCRITGGRLKIGGDGGGIFLAPAESDGSAANEDAWIKVSESALFRNKPSELNFFVPEGIEAGSYRIVLRTAYLAKDRSRKSMLEAMSGALSVA